MQRKKSTLKPVAVSDDGNVARQVETVVEKNDANQTLTIKTKPVNTQIGVDSSNLSKNFVFVYKSVTSVLRDHGLI